MPKVIPFPKKPKPSTRQRSRPKKRSPRITGTPSKETIAGVVESLGNIGSELDDLEYTVRNLITEYKSLLREQHLESGHRILDTLDVLFERLDTLGMFLEEEYPTFADLEDLVARS